MKYVFLLSLTITSLCYTMNENSKLDDKGVEALRKITCEIAFKKIFLNMEIAMDDKRFIRDRNSSEYNIYAAFEFLLKNCAERNR